MYQWNSPESISTGPEYRDAFLELHGSSRMAVMDDGPWAGRLEWQRSARFGVVLCGDVGEEFTRNPADIRADPRETFELLLPMAGSAYVEQGSSSAEIHAGTVAFCDIDRPVSFAHGQDFLSLAVIIPAAELESRSPATVHRPTAFSSVSGIGRLIRRSVLALHEERRHLTEKTFDFATGQLLDLVLLAADGADSAPSNHQGRVEREIREYVRRHAADQSLNIVVLARDLGWSARYLQSVLNAAGTTARDLIRTERLGLAHSRLSSTSWAGYSIAQVAYACGFASHSSFATAYRKAFGVTPRETRKS